LESNLDNNNNSQPAKISYAVRRYIRRHSPFIQTTTAAIFVAATVSATVMLLLWQLQNLASPQDPDGPWFDLGDYSVS
jgi:type VI protein secretion system component VasF